MNDLNAICWILLLLNIIMIKLCVALSLIPLGTLKQNCDIKITKIMIFLYLTNNSETIGCNFLLTSPFGIISSNTIKTIFFFVGL